MSNLTAADAIDQLLLDDTISYNEPYDPMPLDAPHGYWLSSGVYPPDIQYQPRKRALLSAWWWYNMINRANLKDKLTFFLHTTIVNSISCCIIFCFSCFNCILHNDDFR